MGHWRRIFFAWLWVAAASAQHKPVGLPKDYPYRPAFITSGTGLYELVVFPLDQKAFRIRIRSAASPSAFSPDGKSLYGACTPFPEPEDPREKTKVALCKIDLISGTTTPLHGSTGFYSHDLSVSLREDRILASGGTWQGKNPAGLFELTFPTGTMRQIFAQTTSDPKTWWRHVSISPDGERAVASHMGHLEIIDLVHGTSEPLEGPFFIASWSPDGKWLAVRENGEEGRTILMDAKDLSRRRILPSSEVHWSPDSRYLLGVMLQRCDGYHSTLVAIDIETGERTIFQSSKCEVNQATSGWVSAEVK